MTFTGIQLAALDFYEDHSRAFWTAHRDTYEEQVKASMKALADELAPRFGDYKLFRPYRDVRFSKVNLARGTEA